MLGLKYGMVHLVAHDPRWQEAFLNERAIIFETLVSGTRCDSRRQLIDEQ